MYTIEEQERAAYAAGDIPLAAALAARIDMQHALAAEAVLIEGLQSDIEHLESDIEHLKRILADALNNNAWRERAAAALKD